MFAERIKIIRKAKGISQTKMAELLCVDRTRYNKWEAGNHEPSYDILNKIADILGCTTDYLLGRTEKPDYVQVIKDIKGIPAEMHIQKDSPMAKGEFTPEQLRKIEAIVEEIVEQKRHGDQKD